MSFGYRSAHPSTGRNRSCLEPVWGPGYQAGFRTPRKRLLSGLRLAHRSDSAAGVKYGELPEPAPPGRPRQHTPENTTRAHEGEQEGLSEQQPAASCPTVDHKLNLHHSAQGEERMEISFHSFKSGVGNRPPTGHRRPEKSLGLALPRQPQAGLEIP